LLGANHQASKRSLPLMLSLQASSSLAFFSCSEPSSLVALEARKDRLRIG